MTKRSLLAVAFSAATLVGLTADAALAGEVTGNGKPTQGPAHANSICVFSGQNDSPTDPFPEGGRTQSYGQLVSKGAIDPHQFNPGDACRGGCNEGE
jgi:hypothetical protein